MQPDTLFEVTISCRGGTPATYVIAAALPDEAVDTAWAKYEAERGPLIEFRSDCKTRVKRYFPPKD